MIIFPTPSPQVTFEVATDATWPSLVFTTDETGEHEWKWTAVWRTFSRTGKLKTPDNRWDATSTLANLGGDITIKATAKKPLGKGMATVAGKLKIKIIGKNPLPLDVDSYVATDIEAAGFERLISHESKYKHFNGTGQPIRSGDAGYGMCQLTNPAPTFEQVWNWKKNVDAGIKLFKQKRSAAIQFLSQSNRTYTQDQLKRETISRWNGGAYHEWNGSAWQRKANILCDTATGNYGWNTDLDVNKDKTEAELRKRDKGTYKVPRPADANWMFSGVCYADRVME
jgi:hypothetical protein